MTITHEEEKRLAQLVAVAVKDALIGAQGLSSKQASDIALAAGKAAVHQQNAAMFAMFGVNISDAKDMAAFAADVEFLRSMHSNAGAVGKRALMFFLTAILGGLLLAIVAGVKVLIKG